MSSSPGPVLAASAAVFRDGRVLVAKRGRPPGQGLWSLPGGAVERGERLEQAAAREVREETGVEAEIVGLAGHRELIERDPAGAVVRHYVILAFAARWRAGEGTPGPEAAEVRWIEPAEIKNLVATPGLAEIVAQARKLVGA